MKIIGGYGIEISHESQVGGNNEQRDVDCNRKLYYLPWRHFIHTLEGRPAGDMDCSSDRGLSSEAGQTLPDPKLNLGAGLISRLYEMTKFIMIC